MTPAEREQFTDALFDVLSLSGKARTLDDLRGGGLAGGAALLKQYAGADEEKKEDHRRDIPPSGRGREGRAEKGRR